MSTTVDRFAISPRVSVGRGDLVRFTSGGPSWRGRDGERQRLTLRGTWRVVRIIRRGRRVWLDVIALTALGPGERRIAFVSGRSYRRPGCEHVLIRPYRVKRARRREAG